MSGLILKLSPRERLLVNCALIENGDRRARLRILTKDTNILRIKDATNPMAAQTDLEKVFCIAQLIVIDSAGRDELRQELQGRLSALQATLPAPEDVVAINDAATASAQFRDYQCLKLLRAVVRRQSDLAREESTTRSPLQNEF